MENLSLSEVNFVNLCPHDINIYTNDGQLIMRLTRNSNAPRLVERRIIYGEISGIKVNNVRLTLDGVDLPPYIPKTYYIVSRVLAEYARRSDFLIPDELIRDEQGRIIGCTSFAVVTD
jgi:hypothetical protein